jgi:hypothetical protein
MELRNGPAGTDELAAESLRPHVLGPTDKILPVRAQTSIGVGVRTVSNCFLKSLASSPRRHSAAFLHSSDASI